MNESFHMYEHVSSATFMNESCPTYGCVMSHIWMSHVPHMNESCHIYKQVTNATFTNVHVIYEWVLSRAHVPHTNESCHTYEQVISRIWRSAVIHTNESCHTWKWVMSHTWMIKSWMSHWRMSHATRMQGALSTYEWGMPPIWMSHVPCMKESRHEYVWVMSHIWISYARHMYEWFTSHVWRAHLPHTNECCMHMDSHVTHINESCHTYETIMSYMWTLRVVPCMQICDHMHESCSVLHYVAVCCSVLQCVAMRCSEWLISHTAYRVLHTWCVAECCRCAPVCCSEQVISNKNSNRTNHVDHADCLFVDQIMAICVNSLQHTATHVQHNNSYRTNYADCLFAVQIRTSHREVGGWGRDPKKCTGRGWGMGSSTI